MKCGAYVKIESGDTNENGIIGQKKGEQPINVIHAQKKRNRHSTAYYVFLKFM